jgi:hypothetical protein
MNIISKLNINTIFGLPFPRSSAVPLQELRSVVKTEDDCFCTKTIHSSSRHSKFNQYARHAMRGLI